MSPPPTLPLFATDTELTFSDEPRLPIPGPVTADLVFSDDIPVVKVVKKERPPRAPVAQPRRRRASQKAKAAAAARQRDPHYQPLKFNKDFKLVDEPEVAATQLKTAAGPQPKSSSSSGHHRQASSSVEQDSSGKSTPMVSDDESYAPSRTGNRKRSRKGRVRSRKLRSVEDSVSSGFGSDDQTEPKHGLLSSTLMPSYKPVTPKPAAGKPLPPRRRREPSMYTPLKEFLYNGLDASKRKGHVCEEERTEHEKMEISSLRSKLASRIHALETYMATASLAAVGQRMETYDTVEAEVGGTEKAAGVDIVPVVKNKRKRRRRGCR